MEGIGHSFDVARQIVLAGPPSMEQLPQTPDEALAMVMAGNRRFVEGCPIVYQPPDMDVLPKHNRDEFHTPLFALQ